MFARLIIPALVAATFFTPASARPPVPGAAVIVDISTQLPETVLRHRIAAAVEDVCGSYATIEPYQVAEVEACHQRAWSDVDRQLAMIPRAGEGKIALSKR